MDTEVIGRMHAIHQGTIAACDLCGQPRNSLSIVVIDGARGSAEPVDRLRLCRSCLRLMEADELPLDDLDDEEATA
jgi:hypothetical protein